MATIAPPRPILKKRREPTPVFNFATSRKEDEDEDNGEATATFLNKAFILHNESVTSAQEKMNDSLANCVASLKASSQSLSTSIEILDSAVSDYPRVQQVLKSQKHFELTSNAAIREAQNAVVNEIEPEAQRLLRITEQIIAKMERKEKGLMSKAELQEGRITGYGKKTQQQNEEARLRREREAEQARQIAASRANAEKLKQLKAKKERIAYAVERMELQVKQKEREMKMAEGGA